MVSAALRTLGIPIGDVNSARFEDEAFFSRVPMTLRGSYERLGTFREFVEPSKQHVEVMTYSRASKVILDESNIARGVQVERFGQSLQYFASNEVILSAGAIGSPQVSESMQLFSKFTFHFIEFMPRYLCCLALGLRVN